jgi:hypothetical protein
MCEVCRKETDTLPSGLTSVRFHDLLYRAVSRMIAARIPLPIIEKIVGWSAGTMAKILLCSTSLSIATHSMAAGRWR